MSEYYTPEIEEFHVGFEFEMDDTWGGWKKLTLTDELLKHPMVGLGSGNERAPYYHKTRVKYLSNEDIESLGFTDYKHSAYDWYKFSKAIECPIANYNYCGARLLYDRSTSGIIIMGYEYQFELDEDKNAVNLFRGIIKNKSELVKLLKQLGY